MNERILQYRKKHPRCKYCKYDKLISVPIHIPISSYHKCTLKDKYLNDDIFLWDLKGCFCKWFEPEEGDK